MKMKLQYEWGGGSATDMHNMHKKQAVNAVNEITCMLAGGCRTKRLKSKMKRLGSLNVSML